jgi:hypothetical protein
VTAFAGGGYRVTPAGGGLVVEAWVTLTPTRNQAARGVTPGAWMPHGVAYDPAELAGLGVDLAQLQEV